MHEAEQRAAAASAAFIDEQQAAQLQAASVNGAQGEMGSRSRTRSQRTVHKSPINRVTESESSTASDHSPQTLGLTQSSNRLEHGLHARVPQSPFDPQLPMTRPQFKLERNTPTPPHFFGMSHSHHDDLETSLLVTPLPSDESRNVFSALQQPSFTQAQSWSSHPWNSFPDMQLGVPTLSGVGVEDVWNDLHEFSADGFAALDDVLPDVSAPHTMLPPSGKSDADHQGLFPLMNDPFSLPLPATSPLQLDRKLALSPDTNELTVDVKQEAGTTLPLSGTTPKEFELGKGKQQSRFRGVTLRSSGKWQAQIYVQGNCRYLGMYETEQEAAHAYETARRQLEQQGRRSAKRRSPPSNGGSEGHTESAHSVAAARAASGPPVARRSGRAPRPNKRYTDEFEIDVDAADDVQSAEADEDQSAPHASMLVRSDLLESHSPIVTEQPYPNSRSPGTMKRVRDAAAEDSGRGRLNSRPKLEMPAFRQPVHVARPARDAFFPEDGDEDNRVGLAAARQDRAAARMQKLQQLESALAKPVARFLFEMLQCEHRVTLYSVTRPEQQHFKSLFLALLVERGPLNTILTKCNYLLTHPTVARTPEVFARLLEHAMTDQGVAPQLNSDNREKLRQVDNQLCRLWAAYKSKLARSARAEMPNDMMRPTEHMRQSQSASTGMMPDASSMRMAMQQHQQHQQMLAQQQQQLQQQQHQHQHPHPHPHPHPHQQHAPRPSMHASSSSMFHSFASASLHGAAGAHRSAHQYYPDYNEAAMASALRPEYGHPQQHGHPQHGHPQHGHPQQHGFTAVSPQVMKRHEFAAHPMQQQQQPQAPRGEYLYGGHQSHQLHQSNGAHHHQSGGSQQSPFLFSNPRA